MIKPDDPRELAVDLLSRSICSVQVAAVIADSWGNIYSWGWNSVGSGFGEHAEIAAIRRANKVRLDSRSTIYVASQRMRNKKPVISKPCPECAYRIGKYDLKILWRDNDGEWKDMP